MDRCVKAPRGPRYPAPTFPAPRQGCGRSRRCEPVMRPASRSPEPHGGDTIKRNTAFALASQLATASFTAILTIFLVRALGPEDYGIFALALSVASLVFLPADLGISQSTARFVAEHRGENSRVAEVLADGLKLKLISSACCARSCSRSRGRSPTPTTRQQMTWPLRGMALAMFGQSIVGYYRTTFEALGRVSLTLRLIAAESAVEAGASIALVLAGAGRHGRGLRPRDRLPVRHGVRVRDDRPLRGPAGGVAARQSERAHARDRRLRGRAAADRHGLRGDHADRHPADRRDPRHDRRRRVPGAREADHVPALPRAGAVGGRVTAAVARRRRAERAARSRRGSAT